MQHPPATAASATLTVEDGLARAAADLPRGPERRLDRLTLRVPPGAGPAEIERALAAALRARDPGGRRPGR